MIRRAITDYIYRYFFTKKFPEEPIGNPLSDNIVKAFSRPAAPFYLEPVYDIDGKKTLLTQQEATEIARDLGIDLLVRDVEHILADINVHPTVNKILSSHALLSLNEQSLKLLIALSLCFYDTKLLRQPVEDHINGRHLKSEETYNYLIQCFRLFQ